jgi:two-component system, chemotaxis family, sensor kinase Cph1
MSVTGGNLYSLKRDSAKITDCEAEPIQTAGCIQSHGVLLALRASDLTILQVSESCAAFFAAGAEAMLGQAFETLFPRELVERDPLYVATLEFRPRGPKAVWLDISAHTIDGCVILELEPTGTEGAAPVPTTIHSSRRRRGICTKPRTWSRSAP